MVRCASFYHITDAQVIEEAASTWSGRYHWDGTAWDYYAGQYFPVEYRAAVVAILRNLIQREEARPCK